MIKHEFIAGSLALSFVDTLGGRAGSPIERLPNGPELALWIQAAGLRIQPMPIFDDEDVEAARLLREAIHRCGLAAAQRLRYEKADTDLLNSYAAATPLRPELADDGLVWHAKAPLAALLSTLAEDAIRDLASPNARRIRVCPECSMLFLDRSRSGRRRWCSSSSGCGNRAKVRAFRARSTTR